MSPESKNIDFEDHLEILTGIGAVCQQWAMLELQILYLIAAIDASKIEKIEIMFGGLDIKPRINMAYSLAQYARMPQSIVSEISRIRKRIQSELVERRNQLIHGAHFHTKEGKMPILMTRWKGQKKIQEITIDDVKALAIEISEEIDACHLATQRAWSVNFKREGTTG